MWEGICHSTTSRIKSVQGLAWEVLFQELRWINLNRYAQWYFVQTSVGYSLKCEDNHLFLNLHQFCREMTSCWRTSFFLQPIYPSRKLNSRKPKGKGNTWAGELASPDIAALHFGIHLVTLDHLALSMELLPHSCQTLSTEFSEWAILDNSHNHLWKSLTNYIDKKHLPPVIIDSGRNTIETNER